MAAKDQIFPVVAVQRVGDPRRIWDDLYHRLLAAEWRWLMASILAIYLGLNVIFASLYLLGGDSIENARPGSFVDAFFFSVQTMATIGYGKMVPRTHWANVVVSLEALLGLLGTAMATGLMFAKFARPSARVLFSNVAVIVSRDGVPSFVLRLANARGNQIVEASIRISMLRNETTVEGESVRRFHDLELQRSSNPLFAMSWTVVHPITRTSPLHDLDRGCLAAWDPLFVVSLVGMDETSGQTVHARYAYRSPDLRWNERFVDIMSMLPDGRRSIDFTRFHDTQAQSDGAASSPPSAGV